MDRDTWTHFDDANVWLFSGLVYGDFRHSLYPILDRVGQVWDDLDGLAQVISAALIKQKNNELLICTIE